MKLKLFIPAILGTIVEYYDYALYGFAASLIAQHFFPTTDPTIGLLKAYGVFIAGSCSKPLGSLIFGYLGDKYGRSIALKLSMFGIALPTAMVGLIPGYETWGWTSALILLICRMLQGMFVTGESDGVRIFIFESMPKTRPCLTNSISGMATMVGVYFASTATSFAANPSFPDYAWRIPFIVGGIMGVFIVLLRKSLEETPDYIEHLQMLSKKPKQDDSEISFLNVILKNRKGVFITALLYGVVGGGYHFFFVFLGPYLSSTLHILDVNQATLITSNAILIYTLCAPLAGYLADRFEPVRTLKFSAITFLGILGLGVYTLSQKYFPTWLWFLFAVNLSFLHTPGFVVLFKQFSVGERFRCISVGHALGSMALSGTSPFICLQLWQSTQSNLAPLYYFGFLTMLFYLAIKIYEQNAQNENKLQPSPSLKTHSLSNA